MIGLGDVFERHQNINLVLEVCPLDLDRVIKDKGVPLSAADVKSLMLMACAGGEGDGGSAGEGVHRLGRRL